ncbi:MAG TPA: 2-dehydropantoate 2-reductase [Vicinamibacterales bacterium]|nr:2-dehydropantoate 2-reductase [Vicinamibacterales bacterium]
MQIVVLGAGAIGSVYGAKLSTAHDVTLVTRPAHADAINTHGLKVVGTEKATYRPRAATEVESLSPDALVLLTTKVSDSEAAVRPIARLVTPATTILCVQNGLYSENVVKALVGDRCLVLRAITHFGAIFRTPGVVELKVSASTRIEQSPRSAAIADAFTRCGLDGQVTDRIKDEMWQKLVVNCVINPINAITRAEVGAIADERLRPLKQLIVDECRRVAALDGVELPADFVDRIDRQYAPSRNLSSMQQDLLKGRRTEIDFLNGGVVSLGARHGVACSVNQALTMIIKAMEGLPPTDPPGPASPS